MSKQTISSITKALCLTKNQADAERNLKTFEKVEKPFVLSFVNAHAINLAIDKPEFLDCLLKADLLLRDGIGSSILLRCLNIEPGLNMNGTDYIPRILEILPNSSIALYGTDQTSLFKAKNKLAHTHKVVSTMDGFQSYDHYLRNANSLQPEIIIIGMGMPRQEYVSRMLADGLQHPCLIINGGAILDFMANKFPRAPHWVRASGLEWLFRFFNEPRRLFSRYAIGNSIFLWRCLRYRLQRIEINSQGQS